MTLTLLGISGSLTKGGSTRTAIDYALRAAQQRDPAVTTAVLDLRDVALAFCDGRPLHEYPDDTPRAVRPFTAAHTPAR
jgi:NAD(P)H-dependent FMN reductase